MRIPRIYTPQPLMAQQSLLLEPNASKHVLTVLRLKTGASLILFDGSGCEFDAALGGVESHAARVSIGAEHATHSESPLHITLVQGISRGERMDYTIQKAVELGVAAIIPVLTERSVVRLDDKQATRKQQHWQQLAIGACEQSGRVRVPSVYSPVALMALLTDESRPGLKLLLDPEAVSGLNVESVTPKKISLLVGPEGGLSEPEIARAAASGYQRIRLGPRILRTETAALVMLSVLQARWGDLTIR